MNAIYDETKKASVLHRTNQCLGITTSRIYQYQLPRAVSFQTLNDGTEKTCVPLIDVPKNHKQSTYPHYCLLLYNLFS